MKYKYHDQRGRLLCESDSPIKFNLELYPIWKFLKCTIAGEKDTIVAARVRQTEDDLEAEAIEKANRPKSESKSEGGEEPKLKKKDKRRRYS